MAKENFFTRLFSFFKKKPQDGEKSISQTPIVDNDKLQKKIAHLESEIANYKKEITSLEQQLAERQKVQFSGSEIGEKYLALKADFEGKGTEKTQKRC